MFLKPREDWDRNVMVGGSGDQFAYILEVRYSLSLLVIV